MRGQLGATTSDRSCSARAGRTQARAHLLHGPSRPPPARAPHLCIARRCVFICGTVSAQALTAPAAPAAPACCSMQRDRPCTTDSSVPGAVVSGRASVSAQISANSRCAEPYERGAADLSPSSPNSNLVPSGRRAHRTVVRIFYRGSSFAWDTHHQDWVRRGGVVQVPLAESRDSHQ